MLKFRKYQRIKVFSVSLLLFNVIFAFGQSEVKVTLWDNTEQTFSVEPSGKLWFDISDLIINTDNVVARINISLSEIRKITLKERDPTSGSYETSDNTSSIHISPNPAGDYFDLIATGDIQINVRIFDTNGAQVASGKYESGNKVNIAHLKKGLYVVIVNNQSFNLIKQ